MTIGSPDARTAAQIRCGRWLTLTAFLGLTGLAVGVPVTGGPLEGHLINVAFLLLLRQDLPLAPLFLIVLALPWKAYPLISWTRSARLFRLNGPAVACLLLAICWTGHYLILNARDHSRDEQMADFDAWIFSHGHVVWPLDTRWRPFAAALNQTFILPIGDHEAWVSAYLPVNAAFRALVGALVDPALTSPLFVALGALSLWRISAHLFPGSPASRAVSLILYACSSQIILAGMTSFAMSAHLGLDLLWLMLFLRRHPWSDAGAIFVGFLATGLHQPLFHPLFALPFLCLLLHRRDWWRLVAYGVAYTGIGLFWMAWPEWMSAYGHSVAAAAPSVSFVDRLRSTIHPFDRTSAWLMASNLLRFVLWQHLLLMPLATIGVIACWRREPMVCALAAGLILPVIVMGVLLPQQGYGWGYRYLHAVIGNACLLGAFGWRWLEANGRAPRSAFGWTSIATVATMVPAHAEMAQEMTRPAAVLDKQIGKIGAPIAIIDDASAASAEDLVLNRPDLSNRPIRLSGSELMPSEIGTLCRFGMLAFVDAPALGDLDTLYDHPTPSRATPHQRELESAARAGGCHAITIAAKMTG